jgi:hypothetical protein
MLIEEAKWFGRKIELMEPAKVFPMLNVGSSTEEFRKIEQPWIDRYIFKPIREKGQVIMHLDIKKSPGVDIVGDLSDPNFVKSLSKKEFKSVFLSNVLEHLQDKSKICEALTKILPSGGYIFVSCPLEYPFHPDPIDTMFRPNISELASLFPNTRIIHADVVTCGTQLEYIGYKNSLKTMIKVFIPFYKSSEWRNNLQYIPYFYKHFKATCLVLQKEY